MPVVDMPQELFAEIHTGLEGSGTLILRCRDSSSCLEITLHDPLVEEAATRIRATPEFRQAIRQAQQGQFIDVEDDPELANLLARDRPDLIPAEAMNAVLYNQAVIQAERAEFVGFADDEELRSLISRDRPDLLRD